MATTDWDLAGTFQTKLPHTFNALQKLVMAMALTIAHTKHSI